MQDFKPNKISSCLKAVQHKLNAMLVVGLLILVSACGEVERPVIIDNYIYQIDTVPVYGSNVDKDKVKSSTQFISTLYSNLYFSPIPANVLTDLSILFIANGDKGMVNDLIIQRFLNDPAVAASIPSRTEMLDDIDSFIDQTYLRFYLRLPNGYETFGLKQLIDQDPTITPREIYMGFLLSNEYLFY